MINMVLGSMLVHTSIFIFHITYQWLELCELQSGIVSVGTHFTVAPQKGMHFCRVSFQGLHPSGLRLSADYVTFDATRLSGLLQTQPSFPERPDKAAPAQVSAEVLWFEKSPTQTRHQYTANC